MAASAAALWLSAAAAAPQSPPPSFSASAEIVLVDAFVTDQKQRPILDLTAADFQIYEDGARREIVSFAAFGSAATKALARAGPGASEDPTAPFVYASTALVIDEGHVSPEEAARLGPSLTRVLHSLTERRGFLLVLAPLSDVAFAGRLPQDAARLAEAAGRIRGLRPRETSRLPLTDAEALEIEAGDPLTLRSVAARFTALNPYMVSRTDGERRARGLPTQGEALASVRASEVAALLRARRAATFGAISGGLAWLKTQPGRHSLLLVTSGFPHDRADPAFGRVVTESLRVNAPIHFLDVASLQAFSAFETIEYNQALPREARVSPFASADAAAGTEQLARTTGGLRVSGSDLAEGLRQLLDTTKTYYVLGYEPAGRKKPGFRKIRVTLRDDKLRVLARQGYFDDSGAAASPAAPARPR